MEVIKQTWNTNVQGYPMYTLSEKVKATINALKTWSIKQRRNLGGTMNKARVELELAQLEMNKKKKIQSKKTCLLLSSYNRRL